LATDLQIRRVSLGGADRPHSWELPRGVTVIAGDSGGGKTSLLSLIKYGLGGTATITKTIIEAAESVIVEVRLNERELQLTRRFSSKKNVIEVREGEGAPIEYSIKRGRKRPWISDLLLDAVGIPSIRVPQSRSTKTHKLTSISFQDVFAYCYLDQEQIDRSTVFDDESPGRGPKRPWTFELLFGLIDSRVAELEAAREGLAEETEQREKRLVSVEQFIEVKELPGTFADVSRRLEEVDSEVKEVTDELAAQERALELAISETAGRQGQVVAAADGLAAALAEQRRISVELREVSRAANQLERDLDAAREGEAAGEVLDPLTYEVCPRCEQQLGERQVETGHCSVCLQAEPAAEAERESDSITLTEQLSETRALVEQLSRAQDAAEQEVGKRRETLDVERRAFAQASDQTSLPFRR